MHRVRWIDEVLQLSLQRMPVPKTAEAAAAADDAAAKADVTSKEVRAH